ncbi:MAG: hypothetical protein IPQ07_18450 [Myxococcales bacterium]|nr:hypothetical protein [Myxococcales bacterium]
MSNLISSEDLSDPTPRHINSVDATAGQPMIMRVQTRKLELETLLAAQPETATGVRGDITLALSTISGLLSGDLEHLPAVVVADMNRWLEQNKHIGERAVPLTPPIAAIDASADEGCTDASPEASGDALVTS